MKTFKTFFSLLSINTNSFSNESIVVGIIAISNKIHFGYSTQKLNWLNKLDNGQDLCWLSENAIKKLQNVIALENKKNNQGKIVDSLFSIEYFNYLSKYTSGAFKLSEPFPLPGAISENEFSEYYEKFIGEKLVKEITPKSIFNKQIQTTLSTKGLKEKADVNFEFNPIKFDGILKETKLTLITKNGAVQGVQAVDFSKSLGVVANKLYESQMIYEGLQHFAKKESLDLNPLKLAIEIPSDNSPQKALFDKAYKDKKEYFEFIEMDKFSEFAGKVSNSENYQKFSSFIK
jgi:hypothetical protein